MEISKPVPSLNSKAAGTHFCSISSSFTLVFVCFFPFQVSGCPADLQYALCTLFQFPENFTAERGSMEEVDSDQKCPFYFVACFFFSRVFLLQLRTFCSRQWWHVNACPIVTRMIFLTPSRQKEVSGKSLCVLTVK